MDRRMPTQRVCSFMHQQCPHSTVSKSCERTQKKHQLVKEKRTYLQKSVPNDVHVSHIGLQCLCPLGNTPLVPSYLFTSHLNAAKCIIYCSVVWWHLLFCHRQFSVSSVNKVGPDLSGMSAFLMSLLLVIRIEGEKQEKNKRSRWLQWREIKHDPCPPSILCGLSRLCSPRGSGGIPML